jgi:uncharacterized protein YecT (DUF1311 family)
MKLMLKATISLFAFGFLMPTQALAQTSDEACSVQISEICGGADANVCFADETQWQRVVADCVGYAQTMVEMSREATEQMAMKGASWGGSVRSGPGTEFGKIGSLKEGALVDLEDNTGVQMNGYPWFKITQYNDVGGVTLSGFQWGGILCAFDAREGVHQTCPQDWLFPSEPNMTGEDNIAPMHGNGGEMIGHTQDPIAPVHGNSDEDNEMIALDRITECLDAAEVDGSVCIGQVSDPCMDDSNDYTTVGMRMCISLEHSAWDTLLNTDYRRVMDSLDSTEKQTKLRDAQRLWLKYVAAFCPLGYEFNQGTAYLVSGDRCQMEMTARQTLELRKLIAPTY